MLPYGQAGAVERQVVGDNLCVALASTVRGRCKSRDALPVCNIACSSLATAVLFRLSCTQYVFMDMTTYEETRVPRDEDWAK